VNDSELKLRDGESSRPDPDRPLIAMMVPPSLAMMLMMFTGRSAASEVDGVESVEPTTPPAPEGARFRLRPIYLVVPNPTAEKRDRPGEWHGQRGQDRTVNALMPSHPKARRRRFFIDLAANEWLSLSNTRALERDYGWEGLCIEANPKLHAGLLSQRNCTVVGAAIASTEETVRFNLRGVYGGIVGDGLDNKRDNHVVNMSTIPFWRILEQLKVPTTIDYMSLDVEVHPSPA
jgi:hypothetical protein